MSEAVAEETDDGIFERAARLTTSFYAWEQRDRGWDVWPYQVGIEPPFRPFACDFSTAAVADDARRPTSFGALLNRLVGRGRREEVNDIEELDEPEADPADTFEICEIQIALAPDVKVSPETAEHFLLSLLTSTRPISFEVVATAESIIVQMACATDDVSHVQEQLRAYFPEVPKSASCFNLHVDASSHNSHED